jgi:hypothetical protein
MLTETQVVDLLFMNQKYFNSDEVCSCFTHEELNNILMHLENVEEKYFKRIMELNNDPYERSDKNTGRNVMLNASDKIYKYLNKKIINEYLNNEKKQIWNKSYNIGIIFGIIIIIILYFIL